MEGRILVRSASVECLGRIEGIRRHRPLLANETRQLSQSCHNKNYQIPVIEVPQDRPRFHHLIHNSSQSTAIKMAPPKVKKAMSKPPADATRSHDSYPGEHLGRKRAADFFQGDEADPEAKPKASEEPKSRAPKTAIGSEKTKSSKVDGHPVETEKAHPGGDTIEVEPRKKGRPKKNKESGEEQGAPPESADPANRRRGKPKVGEVKKSEARDHEVLDVKGDDDEPTEDVSFSKSKKRGKGQAKKVSSAESTKPEVEATKHKKSVSKRKGSVIKATDDKLEQKPANKPTKSLKATKREIDEADQPTLEAPEKVAIANSKKSTRAELSAEKGKSEDVDFSIPTDLTMDESVFDSLLSSDKGNQSVDKRPLQSRKSSSAKASEKAAKFPTKDGTMSKDDAKSSKTAKEMGKLADNEKGPVSKSKKRKTPPTYDVDAVKTDVLDPLTEFASVKKKQKKSKSDSSALEAAGDSLGSLFSSVKKNAKAAIDFAGNITSGGQPSIMGDIEGVAEGVFKGKNSNKKGSRELKGEIPSEESLLKGLESSADEKDPDEDEGFDQGQLPPPLPESTFDKINAISQPATESKVEEGVVYVGRIPHGFYEHEMRAYFSQFGNINRLRLSRNKTTGASRHYAFIEFVSNEVAKIVEETMNNYLLFGHILKVKSVDPNRLHPNIWKGANRRFKKVPWSQMEGRKLATPMSREQWEKRVQGEQKRRKDKAEKMKQIGYELDAPLKGVDQVPVRESRKAIEGDEPTVEQEKTLVTEPGEEGTSMMIKETVVTKKIRKPSAKAKEIMNNKEAAAEASKKGKRKAEDVAEKAQESADVAKPVSKKAKKAKAKVGQAIGEVTNAAQDASASTVDQVMKAREETAEKAKASLEEAAPIAKKAKKNADESVENETKTTQDVIAPGTKKSKKSSQETGDNAKDTTTQIDRKGKEAARKASEATMAATRTTKKGKKAKA